MHMCIADSTLLTLTPSSVSVVEGDRLTLLCEVSSESLVAKVTVSWLLNGRQLGGVVENNEVYGLCVTDVDVLDHYVMSKRGSLCVPSVRVEDAGQYVCVAHTEDGVTEYATATVSVAGV